MSYYVVNIGVDHSCCKNISDWIEMSVKEEYTLLLLPSIFPSIRVFSNKLTLHIRWSEFWSFSFSISPSKEYSVFISFRIDWFDLLAVQGALKSILQLHSPHTSALWYSAFFMVQLSHPFHYWKNHSFDHSDLCWQSNISVF